jgi:hypothetical protein
MRSSLGIACAMGLAACNGGGGAGNVRLGVLLSTSGENANGGSEALLGVLLAQEEINRAGGVFGESLELVHRDDASDEGTARARATELDASGPVALLGAMASGVTLAVSRVTSADRILQISGSSTSALLTTADDQDFLFRTCASDVLQSRLLARRALQKGFHAVSVIYRPGAYGQELAGAFAAAFTDGGGTLPISKQYSPGQPSYSALLGEVYGAGTPDAVVLIAYTTDAAQIIRDYNTGGFSAMQTFWFFTDAIEDQAFVDLTGASNFTFPERRHRAGRAVDGELSGVRRGLPGALESAAQRGQFHRAVLRRGVPGRAGSIGRRQERVGGGARSAARGRLGRAQARAGRLRHRGCRGRRRGGPRLRRRVGPARLRCARRRGRALRHLEGAERRHPDRRALGEPLSPPAAVLRFS